MNQVILNFDHQAEIFILGADKTLWHKAALNRNSTEFSAFRTMGGHFSSSPSAVTDSEGLIHVFVRGMDRALWHKMQVCSSQCMVANLFLILRTEAIV